MEMRAECVPCLLGRVLFETRLSHPGLESRAMGESLSILADGFRPGVNSARLATSVHRRVYEILEDEDPYRELKVRSDEVAEALLPRAVEIVESSDDRLEAAALCSIAGNVLDFGIGTGFDDPETLEAEFEALVSQGLDVNDLPSLRRLLEEAEQVTFLLDNCGEVVFDKLLLREIQGYGVSVTGVVKGYPVLTDVTLEDAKRSSILSSLDRVVDTGMFAVGLDLTRASDQLIGELERSDVIVCKGMANFESLSDHRLGPTAYLLRAKCVPVAEAIGARKDDNVVRVYE